MTAPDQKEEEERVAAFVCEVALAILAVISDLPDKNDIMREVRSGMDSIKRS
jgi:hypothetical protein